MTAPDGLDDRWSRILTVPDASGVARSWHVLDNADTLTGADIAGTLLCVHGNPTWSYLWRHLIARAATLDPPWRVIAVDQLDMGFSERTGTRRRLGERIDDLGRLTEALELAGPVVTVGHDWGGAVSLGWALAHQDQLAAVVLLNTAVHQPPGSAIPGLIALARLPGVRWAVTAATSTFLHGTLALAHPRLPAQVRAGYLAPYRGRARRRAIDDFVEDIPLSPRHPSWPTLVALVDGLPDLAAVPTLLLWGPRDPVFSDRYLRDLRARLPHAQVHRFEGAGHLLAEDADVAGAVLTWLTRPVPVPVATPPTPAPAPAPAPAPDEGSRRPLWAHLTARAQDPGVAVVEPGHGGRSQPRRISWQQLADRVQRTAAGLAATGVRPGDRVALLVPPGADLTIALYACLRIGAVVVIADAGLGLSGLHRAVRGAGVQHVIAVDRGLLVARALRWPGRRFAVTTTGPLRRAVLGTAATMTDLAEAGDNRQLPPPPAPDDDAMVVFTSGATGPAKGVVYTHRQLEAVRDLLSAAYPLHADDRFVAAFAPFALFGPALGTASAVPDMDVTAPRTLTAAALADAVHSVDATVVFASPAALANVVATASSLDPGQRAGLSRVRLLLSAGAPVPTAVLIAVQDLMPTAKIHTPYGMTEVLLVSDVELADLRTAGPGDGVLVGRPMAGVEVRIAPLDPSGVTGEILVRAAHGKDRYDQLWVTENATRVAEGIAGPVTPGWHRTGDVGHLDDDGRLWVEGRTVHVITTAAGFVTPVGLERRVETVPGVARAALVGVGTPGDQHLVVVLETSAPARPGVADPALTAEVRAVAGAELAAVLVTGRLKTDIRHNSKIDRRQVGRWATRVLAGGRRGSW